MKVKVHALLGVAAVFVLTLGANLNNYVKAEDVDGAASGGSKGLSVSPSIEKLGVLEPGQTYEREIYLTNLDSEEKTFEVLTSSFWVEDENYDVKWGVSDSQYGKIADWTDIDSSEMHTVGAGETYVFKYKISVPEDQPGGAQRLMVAINLGSDSNGSFVNAETRINTLVYATIDGDARSDADLVSRDIQGFSFVPSISTTSVLENTGNLDLDVSYRMVVRDFFSGREVHVAEDDRVLMAESTRMYEQKWDGAPLLGIFSVTQQIEFMGEARELEGVTVICPLWLVIVFVVAVALIVMYFVHRRKMRNAGRVKE